MTTCNTVRENVKNEGNFCLLKMILVALETNDWHHQYEPSLIST